MSHVDISVFHSSKTALLLTMTRQSARKKKGFFVATEKEIQPANSIKNRFQLFRKNPLKIEMIQLIQQNANKPDVLLTPLVRRGGVYSILRMHAHAVRERERIGKRGGMRQTRQNKQTEQR